MPVSQTDVARMQADLNGKQAAVAYLEDGAATPSSTGDRAATLVRGKVQIDLLSVRTLDGGNERSVPLTQVKLIEHVDYDRGVRQGMAIGLGVGALLGGVLGYTIGDDCSDGAWFCLDRREMAGSMFFTFGLVGALSGALAGGSSGAVDYWILGPGVLRW